MKVLGCNTCHVSSPAGEEEEGEGGGEEGGEEGEGEEGGGQTEEKEVKVQNLNLKSEVLSW